MKKVLVSFFLFLLLSASWAQNRRQVMNDPGYDSEAYHFGFMLGLNTMDFNIRLAPVILVEPTDTPSTKIKSILNYRNLGFNIHIVTNLRLGEFWDLRFTPGLAFGQRDIEYSRDTLVTTNPLVYSNSKHKMMIESTFLDFPLLIKYRSERVDNYRPYIIAGICPAWDLESQKKIKPSELPKIRLTKPDLYIEAGFGVDYFMAFFKLATEIKFSYGLNNMVKRDNTAYTKSIEKMTSKMVTLAFYFE